MPRDFFDPTPEDHVIVVIEDEDLLRAEKLIESCEHCNMEGAEIPFDHILDRVTGSDPSVADYLMEEPAICPFCQEQITEKTLAEPS